MLIKSNSWCPDQSALSMRAHINGEQNLRICEPIPVVKWHLPGMREVPRSIPGAGKVRIFCSFHPIFPPQEFQNKKHPGGIRVNKTLYSFLSKYLFLVSPSNDYKGHRLWSKHCVATKQNKVWLRLSLSIFISTEDHHILNCNFLGLIQFKFDCENQN